FSLVVFLCVTCAIYFVATGDSQSLGQAGTWMSLELFQDPKVPNSKEESFEDSKEESNLQPADGFTETPFMPKMANETLKAKLGNSAWHLFHTVLARYPDEPTVLEKTTLKLYIHLFAQVYPCGDCARHFSQLLKKYPVQVGSRKTAALWGCHIHNKVNERLEKPEYDCTKILEDYDCGCGADEKEQDDTLGDESAEHLRMITLDEIEGKQLGG
ncbi:hypothetical protein METBIDRAFT_14193, partial [Metschnikowia bicuspidata var. bicuspidata NRRL YB-4993]